MQANFSQARALPSLTALRAFEAVCRLGSAKAAAQELHVTPAAISHQIRHLEEELGVALFRRLTRQLVPTPQGLALQAALTPAFDAVAEAVQQIRRGPMRRVVTMSVTPAIATRWLLPRMPRLRSLQPALDLRLQVSHGVVPLDDGSADLAIRYGRGIWPGLSAHRLIDNVFIVACSPMLQLQRRSQLRRQTLLHFAPLGTRKAILGWKQWQALAGVDGLDASAGPVFSDETHVIAAALAGQGIALVSRSLVHSELENGQLHCPFGPELQGQPFHLVYAQQRTDDPDILAVRNWLLADAEPGKGPQAV